MEPSDLRPFAEIQGGKLMISIKKNTVVRFSSRPVEKVRHQWHQALLTEQPCIVCLPNPDVSIIIALILAGTCIPFKSLSLHQLTMV